MKCYEDDLNVEMFILRNRLKMAFLQIGYNRNKVNI